MNPIDALVAAASAAEQLMPDEVVIEKAIWGSSAGKKHLAKRIVDEMPEHRIYVEPFAGGAQVLFAKDASEVEVVNDLDPDIAFAFKFAKGVTPDQLAELRRRKWVGDKEHFLKLRDSKPEGDVDRFYRFAYLSRFSFNTLRRGTMPEANVGANSRFVDKLEQWAPRLKKIRVRCDDYAKVLEEFDGPDTFFFLDPPYAGYNAGVGGSGRADHKEWDEARFGKIIRGLKGKFLVTYGTRGDPDLFKGLHVRKWRHMSGVGSGPGRGQTLGTTIIATNYDSTTAKRFVVEKTVFGSPAGKKRLAVRLAGMLPAHKTYVEPFAGSAAVFFATEPCGVEVLNDADPDIARAYKTIQKLTAADIDNLRKMDWTGNVDRFKKLYDSKPECDVEWLHKFLYVAHFSYGRLRGRSFSPASDGVVAKTVDRIAEFAPRLKNAHVYSGDYETVCRKYDGPNTVFFLDPPYPGYNVDVGESSFDEERFFKFLKSLKGKFLITYGIRGKLPKLVKAEPRFTVKTIRTPRTIRAMRGVGGSTMLSQLLISNYEPAAKAMGEDFELVDDVLDLDGRQATALLSARAITAILRKSMPAADGRPAVYARALDAITKLDEALGDVEPEGGVDDDATGKPRGTSSVGVLAQMLYEALEQFGGTETTSGAPFPEEVARAAATALNALKDLLAVADWFGPNRDDAAAPGPGQHDELATSEAFKQLAVPETDPARIADASDEELADAHRKLHGLFARAFAGNEKMEAGGVNVLDVIDAEIFTQAELLRREKPCTEEDALAVEAAEVFRFVTSDEDTAKYAPDQARDAGRFASGGGSSGGSGSGGSSEHPRALANNPSFSKWAKQRDSLDHAKWASAANRRLTTVGEGGMRGQLGEKGWARYVQAARARQTRAGKTADVDIAKAKRVPFQQWGGSGMYARQIVDRFPAHKVYAEPFAGAAAVFYAKEPAEKEILSDLDQDVVFAHQFIQGLDEKKMAALKKLDWRVSRPGFARCRKLEPRTDTERFWRHAYGRLCSWGAKPLSAGGSGFATIHDGQVYGLDDLWKFRDRLKGVRIVHQDWQTTVKEADSRDTLFFLDPPYVNEWGGKKDDSDGVPPEEVAKVCAGLKGQFVIAYTDSPRARKALSKCGRAFKIKVREGRHAGQWLKRSRLFVASDGIAKSLGDTCEAIEWVDAILAKSEAPTEAVPGAAGNAPTEDDVRAWARAHGHEGDTFTDHAKAWVKSHGLLDADADYGGMLGEAVIRMAETFSSEGHSGMSAQIARAAFNWLCDAWDGLHTMMLNDADFEKARTALAKCARDHIDSLVADAVMVAARADDLDAAGLERALVEDTPPAARAALAKQVVLKRDPKADEDERFVLGVVLEPETVDSQKDVYSASTVRTTAHKFMEDFRHIGLMHRGVIDERVRILESYLAPVDFEIDGATVKRGTWLLAVRVLDDKLWELVKRGVLTGYSIGGTALREGVGGGR